MGLTQKDFSPLPRWRQLCPADSQKIGRHDGRPNVGFECLKALPGATGKAHTAFEPRNPGLDTCTKAAQFIIYIFTATHVRFFDAAFFGKAHILYLACLGPFKVLFGSKTTVKAHLERVTLVYLFLTIEHRDGQIHISRIAPFNDTIENQVGGTPLCQDRCRSH